MKESFLFKHRFTFGYILLAITFIMAIISLANIAPVGLSQAERDSITASSAINLETLGQGNVVNFPYHSIQHLFLWLFGLNFFSIKLPTILFAIATGIFILLFNRHFTNTIAILSSIMSLFSVAILFVSGNGSPLIMYPFWLSMIIWLGSKLINQKKPNALLAILFVASLIFSLYTPYMLYAIILIIIAGFFRPHARFVLHKLGALKIALCVLAIAILMMPFIYFLYINPTTLHTLLAGHFADFNGFLANLQSGFAAIVPIGNYHDNIFLSPLFNLAVIIIAFIGLISLIRRWSTAYSLVIFATLIFSIVATGLDANSVTATFIPIILLTGVGISALVNIWYSYFPNNPYAHLLSFVPLAILSAIIILSNFTFFISGYTYAPVAVHNFNNDLSLIQKELKTNDYILVPAKDQNFDFYNFVAARCGYRVITDTPHKSTKHQIAAVQSYPKEDISDKDFKLKRIVTSSRAENSDRLYIYTTKD